MATINKEGFHLGYTKEPSFSPQLSENGNNEKYQN